MILTPAALLVTATLAVGRDAARRGEALLQRCAAAPPRPDFLVEDAHYAELAALR